MTRFAKIIALGSLLALGACWTEGDDQAAANVEEAFENQAQSYEQAAENASGAEEERLEDTAEVYEKTGEAAAEAVDDADLTPNAQ